jgi:hypothetical protein
MIPFMQAFLAVGSNDKETGAQSDSSVVCSDLPLGLMIRKGCLHGQALFPATVWRGQANGGIQK